MKIDLATENRFGQSHIDKQSFFWARDFFGKKSFFGLGRYHFLEYWPQSDNFWFNTIHSNRRYCQKIMRNIQQLCDPWGYIIFLKYETTLEKHLTKSQNLTLYKTNLKFLYIIAKISLTHVSLITLNHLDPIVEKWEFILHKEQTNFLRVRTLHY